MAVEIQFLSVIGGKFVDERGTISAPTWEHTRFTSVARKLAIRLACRG